MFLKLGEVEEIRLVKDRNGRSKGYAYVQFKNEVMWAYIVLSLLKEPRHCIRLNLLPTIFYWAKAFDMLLMPVVHSWVIAHRVLKFKGSTPPSVCVCVFTKKVSFR